MCKFKTNLLAAMLGLFLFNGVGFAAEEGEQGSAGSWFDRLIGGTTQNQPSSVVKNIDTVKQVRDLFSASERTRILDYYRNEHAVIDEDKGKRNKKKKLPPGLQKKIARGDELPPGWQAKVARGQVLDAQLLSHASYLPSDLTRKLPDNSDGAVIRRIGDKVVRVLEGNGTVLDVIDLADVVLRY